MLKMIQGELHTGPINFELKKRLIVVYGVNGSGKTLLLNFLEEQGKLNKISTAFHIGLAGSWRLKSAKDEEQLVDSLMPFMAIEETKLQGFPKDFFIEGLKHTSRLIALLDFIQSNKSTNLVLIDDIETGLHMIVQQALYGYIEHYTEGQVVFTTHSPSVMMGITKDQNDHILSMDNVYEWSKILK